jgi:hypothetical protein
MLQYLNTFPWFADNRWYVAWYCYCDKLQYSELAAEVQKGRGRIPVADYKIVKSVGEKNADELDIAEQSRSCYSFCMCPGGQVSHLPFFNLPPSLWHTVYYNAMSLKIWDIHAGCSN